MLLFYSEHVIYECFKTCLRDIFMHNNVTFKFINTDQQLLPDAADIFPFFLQPPYSNFTMQRAVRRGLWTSPLLRPPATHPVKEKTRLSTLFFLDKDAKRRIESCLCCGLGASCRNLLWKPRGWTTPTALTAYSSCENIMKHLRSRNGFYRHFAWLFLIITCSTFMDWPFCCREMSQYSWAATTCSFKYNFI